MKALLLNFWLHLPEYDEMHSADRLFALVSSLSADESEEFEAAFGEVLPLLDARPDLAQAALDLAVRADLTSVIGGAFQLARRLPTGWALLGLASLAYSPSVSSNLRSEIDDFVGAQSTGHSVQRGILLRSTPSYIPESTLEYATQAQMWPGIASRSALERVTPTVYMDTDGASARDNLRLTFSLIARGAQVRRIPDAHRQGIGSWFSANYPIATFDRRAARRLSSRLGAFNADQLVYAESPLHTLALSRVIGRVAKAVQSISPLRSLPDEPLMGEAAPLSRESLRLGAFDVAEMAFLSSTPKRAMYEFAREGLEPLPSGGVAHWSFDRLVALRTYQYFRKATGRTRLASPTMLLGRFQELSMRDTTSRIAVSADGHVYVDEQQKGWMDISTGQAPIVDVIELDAVFQPFSVGAGQVPALLEPSRHTSVHPARVFGTPVVRDTRISARSLARSLANHGLDATLRNYPDISESSFRDAVSVGGLIMSTQ